MSQETPLTEAEWAVMQAVWKRSPATARDVLEEVELLDRAAMESGTD